MAVRFDVSTDRLLRTTDLLSYNSAYTMMGWIRLTSDRNDWTAFWAASNNSVGDIDFIGTNATGTTLNLGVNVGGGGGTDVTGSSLSVATWYHLASVRVSATSLLLYLNGVQDINNTRDISGRIANSRIEHGAHGTANSDPFDGSVANIKAWSTNLSAAEIQAEMYTWWPRRYANLYGWWPTFPGATERLADWSGNGRVWTAGGTLTDEDPPPLVWTVPIWKASASIPAIIEQEGYRFGRDTGVEASPDWIAAQDTPASIARLTNFRLRSLLNASGDPLPLAYTYEYRKPDSLDWRRVQ